MSGNEQLTLNPIPATVLADDEAARRDRIARLGRLRTGCDEVDSYVLAGGGFERGSVVGLSAEEEDEFGVPVRFFLFSLLLLLLRF